MVLGFLGRKKAAEEGQKDQLPKIGLILGVVGIIAGIINWILVATGVIDVNMYSNVGA